jgi:hypothetical protein
MFEAEPALDPEGFQNYGSPGNEAFPVNQSLKPFRLWCRSIIVRLARPCSETRKVEIPARVRRWLRDVVERMQRQNLTNLPVTRSDERLVRLITLRDAE